MELNSTPPVVGGGSEAATEAAQHEKSVRLRIGMFGFFLFIVFVVGLFWMFTTPNLTVGLTLSFVAGLSMIFLPCTLPLAFVIVPLTLGKDPKKGLLMALSFTLGLTITLSLYGVFIAAAGKAFGLKSDAEVYAVLLGGFAAFIFGLSEVGLIKFKLPSYSGNFPDFIQRQKDYMKTFLLGLLLGNAGVGCPNPAFYVLLGYIATTGDLFNGWFLGFVHGMGRSVPLIFLAILGTLGVNALSGVARYKETIGKVMGWMLLIIGAYLLTFGIFGHDWFIASGTHSAWEQFVVNISGDRFGETILKHEHPLVDVSNFIKYGNLFFLGLLAITILTAFIFRRPTRRTIVSLSITYIAIALVIGNSTGWTFTVPPPSGHSMTMSKDTGGAHEKHGGALYHEESDVRKGIAVNLNITPVPFITGQSQKLDFFVNEKPGNVFIPVSDLQIQHEKKMHVIGVRKDLNEFFHVHPIASADNPAIMSVNHVFKKSGEYKIWSEIKYEGTNHAFGHVPLTIKGYDAYEVEKEITKSKVVAGYQVSVDYDNLHVGDNELHFSIKDSQGRDAELDNYLGEKIHLSIIKDDWTQFIHAHPEGGMHNNDGHSENNLINFAFAHGGEEETPSQENMETAMPGGENIIHFNVNLEQPGFYKAFAQFKPSSYGLLEPPDPNQSLLAEFWLQVSEEPEESMGADVKNKPFDSIWWRNLFVSFVLIVLLSWGVKKYITPSVKAS